MTVFETPAPAFSAAEAIGLAKAYYGFDAQVSPLASERDQNFRVDAGAAGRFVLKIANVAEERATLQMQVALLKHVAAADPALPLPKLVPAKSGDDFAVAEKSGRQHAIRLVTYLEGTPFAKAAKTPETLLSLGRTLGRLDRALRSFGHPAAHQDFLWDLRKSGDARKRLGALADDHQRKLAMHFLDRFDAHVAPVLPHFRASIIHNDANDWNILVASEAGGPVTGLIDLGDTIHTITIAELAIAAAYAMLDADRPLDAGARLIEGYHSELPLEPLELVHFFDLIAARLVTSVTLSAERREKIGDNPYLAISEKPAWALLERLAAVNPAYARGLFRQAAGLEAAEGANAAKSWIARNRLTLHPLMSPDPYRAAKAVLPLHDADDPLVKAMSVSDPAERTAAYESARAKGGFEIGVGLWGEVRKVYTTDAFRSKLALGERRDMHLGLDLFADAGTPMLAPLDAVVIDAANEAIPQGFGGCVLLEHQPEPGVTFRSLWGHLSPPSIAHLQPGMHIARGEAFGRLGGFTENGGWIPHLHLQLVLTGERSAVDIPGVGESRYLNLWADLYPDVTDFARVPRETIEPSGRAIPELLVSRRDHLLPNLSVAFGAKPLKIVRGEGVNLIDATGRAYLDCFNNVAHVGHCHPRVVEAIARQAAILNTNTRYLHDGLLDYAERITASLPASLSVVTFVCSGSEAIDLAVRMAKAHTKRKDFIVVDWAYHGHTEPLIDLSPYKYKRPGGGGRPEHVHEVPLPDSFRAPVDWPVSEYGKRFAAPVGEVAQRLIAEGRPPAAFFAESVLSCGGQIFLPDGYLREAYRHARSAGAVTLADEVQVGFGRTGSGLWEFESHGVVPDMVALGKPIGAGHPMAALVTTPEIARSFANGMEYFNTFGGNPVSAAAGLAVLDVLEGEGLIANARDVGNQLISGLWELHARYPVIGDVRGKGLFLGLDLVENRLTKKHDGKSANWIVARAKELGVLLGTDGPYDNVIKIRPPMTFGPEHAAILLGVLDQCFAEHARGQ